MQTTEQSVRTSQLLNPERGADESYADYVKRRRDINKVVKAHLKTTGEYNAEYHLKSMQEKQRGIKQPRRFPR